MNILAFDTAGSFLSTALKTGKDFFEENRSSGLRHSEYLLPSVNRLIEKAGISFNDLDLIVCTRGPGSFTGLRIGMSTAKGISAGCNTPVVSVNTLDALAYEYSFFDGAVIPLIDARKNRFYTAVYSGGKPLSDYLDIPASEVAAAAAAYGRVLFTGTGKELFRNSITDDKIKIETACSFTAVEHGLGAALIDAGRMQYEKSGPDADNTGPFYIRLSDAELSRK